ncbi:MAG: transcriptional regulator [Rhodospirillaceae bacterium]|nr:MAG: transcriptional regulator [Rhodospirillaceae bacterium]
MSTIAITSTTKKTRTTPFDGSFHLKGDVEAQLDVLNDAFDSGHAGVVALALRDIAKAQGMTEVAKKVGITRAGLYRALSGDGDPKLSTVVALLKALGIKIEAKTSTTVNSAKGVARRQRAFKHPTPATLADKPKAASRAA